MINASEGLNGCFFAIHANMFIFCQKRCQISSIFSEEKILGDYYEVSFFGYKMRNHLKT